MRLQWASARLANEAEEALGAAAEGDGWAQLTTERKERLETFGRRSEVERILGFDGVAG